jgi:serine/threonine protein kinase/tetratricopeptide (TPR) repeat protein
MPKFDTDRNLLFGLLALQTGLIDQGSLFTAFNVWTRDKARSMAAILVEQGNLDTVRCSLVDGLVAEHLKMHGDDLEKSLAAIAVDPSSFERLARMGDAELAASVAVIGSAHPPRDGLPDEATPIAVPPLDGGAWSVGQQDLLVEQHRRWAQGERVLVEAFLERDPGLREAPEPLLDLIYNEIILREQHGEAPGTDEYLRRFPELSEDIRKQFEIHRVFAEQDSGASGETVERTATFAVGTSSASGLRFRVLRPHARGGLGAVFVALDTELNREVALKQILDRHADDPSSRRRFLVEAEIAGGLEHPGIVPVYGLGSYANGRPFYAMRFIRGDSLKDAVSAFHSDESSKRDAGRHSLELRKLLRRFVDVCNAIEYAHSRGVLHRDLKPANIIVGKHGETLVVDWGLAKAVGRPEPSVASEERTLVPAAASGSSETLPGSALGTPAFMSPEQAAGDLDRLGPRSDVYSLGATLYVILTGLPPFEGNDVGAMLESVQLGEFPKPRKHDPSIDRSLEAICLKAMQRAPEDRYASVRLLADDVERWMADEPVIAWREPFGARARRWARRHRTLVVSSAAVLVIGLAGLTGFAAVVANKNLELDAKNSELVVKNKKLDAKDVENKAVLKFFEENVLAAARPKTQDGGLGIDATVRAAVDAAEPGIAQSFGDQPTAEASIRSTLGQSYLYLGEPAQAVRQLERTVALRRVALGVDNAETLASTTHLARAYQESGRIADALRLHQETLERCKAKLGSDHQDTLVSMNDLACAYLSAGRLADAVPLFEETIKRRNATIGPNHPDTLSSMNNLATAYQDAGQLDQVVPLFDEILKRQRAALGPTHPDTLITMNNLARAYLTTGQFDRARPIFEETLELQRRSLGPNHADTLITMGNLAVVHRSTGRLADALRLQQETYERCKAKLGPDHFDTLRAMSNLANTLGAMGRLADALPLLEETLKRRKATLGINHPDSLRSMYTLARAYFADQPSRAEALAREALAIREKGSPGEWLTFSTRSLLGASLLRQKNFAGAEPLLLDGYEGLKAREAKIPAYARSQVAEAGGWITELYESWGNKEKAAAWKNRLAQATHSAKPPP